MTVQYWLMKSEPFVFSIDDLARRKEAEWDGVRNYQARNNLRKMRRGDLILFYHSSVIPPCVAGLARVTKEAYPDPSQWDKKSEYFDSRATQQKPLWDMINVEFVEKFPACVSRDALRANPALREMIVVRHTRLSVQPVAPKHFDIVKEMASSRVTSRQ